MRSKYSNQRTNGYASKKEAQRYAELKLLVKAKKITNLQLQPDFLLQLSYTDYAGRKHNAIHYFADFMYTKDGQTIVEDVKGMQTPVYKLKKKLLLFKYTQIIFNEL